MSQVNIISIIIVDDHSIIRHGLKQSLSQEKDMVVVAEANSGRGAIELMSAHKPDIIIMDVSMPDMNGIEATRQILKLNPGVKILALSMHPEKQFVLSMIRSGARGYILKTNFFKELLIAIRTVMEGNVFLSPEITEHLVKYAISPDEEGELLGLYALTTREREILQLLAEGWTNSRIAEQFFISKKTVASHRQNIMKKLNLYNISALTKFAIKQGITTLEI